MVYPNKWLPVSCRSSAGQGKFAGERPTFYHCGTRWAEKSFTVGSHGWHVFQFPYSWWRQCIERFAAASQVNIRAFVKSVITRTRARFFCFSKPEVVGLPYRPWTEILPKFGLQIDIDLGWEMSPKPQPEVDWRRVVVILKSVRSQLCRETSDFSRSMLWCRSKFTGRWV